MDTDPTRWARIDAVLDAALDLPEGERAAFVAGTCGGDAALERDVLALLAADARAGGFLAPPDGRQIDGLLGADDDQAVAFVPGRVIGAYRLTGVIGEGGMGVVYDAERADGQFESRVALKVLRWTGASDDARRRFLRERQILAQLEHPHIARLLDGGVTDDGLPYFVMERVVPGTPLTTWCEDRDLDVAARLDLVLQACDAVQYAHRRLVVHRDLKPTNIVVDASGAVKLLDFGIAKLLVDDDAPSSTMPDARPMTPAYAAPEQVSGAPITTATDVYALGVVLYVVLTGRLPYAVDTGRITDWARAILDTSPKRPSAAAAEPRRMARLRGDLDRIVLKALEKEPTRRYSSVEALADDIRRHLTGLPVNAHEASRWYRARKFVGRNRLLVGGVAATMLALAVGLGAAAWQARIARAEAARAEAVQRFLVSIFEQADPDQRKGAELTAREILDKGAQRIDAEFGSRPEVRSTLWSTVRNLYSKLGAHADSVTAGRRAVEATAASGTDSLAYARALRQLATSLSDAEQNEEAQRALAEALPIIERRAGERSDETIETLLLHGWITSTLGQPEAGIAEMRRARALAASVHGPDSEPTARVENDLLVALGDADEALELAQHVADVYGRTLGTASYQYSLARYNLGNQQFGHGRWNDAAKTFATVLPLQERLLGTVHPETALTYRQVARLSAAQGDFEQARAMMAKAIAALEATGATRSLGGALARNQFANIERMSGRFEAGIALGEQAVATLRGSNQTTSNLALALATLSAGYRGAGDLKRAMVTAQEAVRISEGTDQRWLGASLLHLGAAQLAMGPRHDASATLQRAPAAFEAAGQSRSTDRASAMRWLADAGAGSMSAAEREALYKESQALFAAVAPAEQGDALDTGLAYAVFLRDAGRRSEAAAQVTAVLAAFDRSTGLDPARRRMADALARTVTPGQ